MRTIGIVGGLWIVAVGSVAGAAPRPAVIDFTQEGDGDALGDEHTAPPPDVQHPSLIQGRYRGVPESAPGEQLDDPLATPVRVARPRPVWLGARLGAGMFDDGASAVRPGVALGVTGRYRLDDARFLAARADWSRRGGEAMTAGPALGAIDAIDVLGASAGAGLTVARSASSGLALALIGELRGDLRLTDQRGAAAVHRAGLSVAVGAELALPPGPFTLGVRCEQGITELVAGARDRAILAEVGIDLR